MARMVAFPVAHWGKATMNTARTTYTVRTTYTARTTYLAAVFILSAACILSAHRAAQAAEMLFGAVAQVAVDNQGCAGIGGPTANNASCGFSIDPAFATASRATSSEPGTAQATANLATGFVSAAASSSGTTASVADHAYAHALLWDTLTFSGALPGAQITLTMSGTWGGANDARVQAFSALVLRTDIVKPSENLGLYLSGIYVGHDFSDGVSIAVNGCCTPAPSFTGGTYSFTKAWPVYNDVPMVLFLNVSAFSGGAGRNGLDGTQPGNAFITDPLTLDLPTGVTFTSAFAQAVPEPSSLLLLAAGLAGLWRARRASGSAAQRHPRHRGAAARVD